MNFRHVTVAAAGIFLLFIVSISGHSPVPAPRAAKQRSGGAASASTTSGPELRAFVGQYCIICHSERLKTGGLVLENVDFDQISKHSEIWEKVIHKLSLDAMPPPQAKQPDGAAKKAIVASLEQRLDAEYLAARDPGSSLIHRLNRAEYANAIRELFDLDVDVADLLPADSASFGFDNISESLVVSPLLLQRYLAASERIARIAVGDPTLPSEEHTYAAPKDHSGGQPVNGMPPGTMGGIAIQYNFPLDAEYLLRATLVQTLSGGIRGMEGETNPYYFEIAIDGNRVLLAPIGGKEDGDLNHDDSGLAVDVGNGRLHARVPVKAGPHRITFAFLDSLATPQVNLEPPVRDSMAVSQGYGAPKVKYAYVTGPLNATGPGNTPSRRRIFICRPTTTSDEVPCATRILANVARRAFARRSTSAEMKNLMELFTKGRAGGSFDRGIQMALPRILTGPEFLFRAQPEPTGLASGAVFRISDSELATRLALFLWSSIPDDTLIELAAAGKLRQPGVLEPQVHRMLKDPRSKAFLDNFAGQWLYLRNLDNTFPDPNLFGEWDDNLRQSFKEETLMLFESIAHEDRSVLTLLTADYTFVNERLAKFYGIPDIYGTTLRRVPLTDPNRRGLFGQGSFLTLTSIANRTAPTIRGKWILTELLAAPPPPPPPDLSNSLNKDEGGTPQSMRQILERHRRNTVCANCHRLMDPIGLAFENFDATGKWRTTDEGQPIDSSTVLFNGAKVDGPVQLRAELLKYSDVIAETFTQKLMTYALARGVMASDFPAVRMIVRDAARNDYRFSSIVLGIVNSVPFQMRAKRAEPVRSAAAN